MATRFQPVRPIASGPWVMPDRLARRLSRLVAASREAQHELTRRHAPQEPLGLLLAELSEQARRDGLDAVLPRALGLGALACHRLEGRRWEICGEPSVWELLPRDNQLACAAVLAQGDVAELDTGEGKTLCVALAAACCALTGRVHVVTANDYLARRDFEWMSPLLLELGLNVGLVHHETEHSTRQEAYLCDVTYVSIKEIGADYLRDTLTSDRLALLLPGLESAILDEIDFILVDEARIPLILAQQVDPSENLCHQFNQTVADLVAEQAARVALIHDEIDRIADHPDWNEKKKRFEVDLRLAELLLADPLDPRLNQRYAESTEAGDGAAVRRVRDLILRFEKTKRRDELLDELLFTVDRRARVVQVTERGLDRLQDTFGDLFTPPSGDDPEEAQAHHERLRAVHNLLAGHMLYRRDRDYMIEEGKVVLIDQSTGRPSYDRHLQHGLHRALEAKEGLYPALDHQTAAEITFPGLFQLYRRFCGTSGTCLELGEELGKLHNKKVVRVPPHRPVIRADLEDVVFRTAEEKVEALIAELEQAARLRQPLLIGTSSVEQSEWVSAALSERGIAHQVLNARHHEQEARIIARAGEPGTVTVATTMAGRGTDIRPPADLPRLIAEAAADWAADVTGPKATRGGLRLQLFSEFERDELTAALDRRGLPYRLARSPRRAPAIDIGPKPPPTAFPLCLGLRIIAFERLGAQRLDRQLRGRTGRQGSPGSTRFYLALDDELVLIYGDRARLAELTRKSRPLIDPLSGRPVRSGRPLAHEVQRAWSAVELLSLRQRQRLAKLDAVDQAQRQHYDAERQALLFADDRVVAELADQAIARAARGIAQEILAGAEHLQPEREGYLDDLTEVLFERRGLARHLLTGGTSPKSEQLESALAEALARLYRVARQSHGVRAMNMVERTVLLDALTEAWRGCSAERPDLRQQAELYAYANRNPDEVYRNFAGQAYHHALNQAARTAASVLVTFPLPREIKTPRTGLPIASEDVLALFGAQAKSFPCDRSS
jgi:preprotein translocase subunit SecA